ncbi:AAA family ATPase [Raineya orbicola]|uniref:Putative AAA-ATPase n=1 Tax=Raineya orbicola TaxID=2016530 RepID=A0A2N3IJ02_9BACT|nr:AAA family ATPase [Raineya orbicola]PKQ70251.1 putative AAA-ATPase [Raineya orbicola]
MKPAVFFPYGLSNFPQVVSEYIYVDKTSYIELLETMRERFLVYLRPRRFGKSLFVSLLEHYYDINRKADFQKLFANYYIGKNPTSKANSYRILLFNFSAIDTRTEESTYQDFLNSIITHIEGFCLKYKVLSERQEREIFIQKTPEMVLRKFFEYYLQSSVKEPIYLLIDEYDHFTNEILARSIQEFKETVSLNGYVRKFYEAIKNATQQGIVDRFFITGVSPITMDSLTSGFNIVKHLTHHKNFEAMMGFSEAEVRELLNLVLNDKSREDQIMQDLRDYYNGYRFYPLSEQNIYNSDMVLYFLDHFKHEQTYPRQMLDPNIAPDYGKLKQMFQVANLQANLQVLEEVLEKGSVESEQIYQFHFEKDFGKKEFVNFLFYLGNLTIKETLPSGFISFKVPNKVIGDLYWQYYSEILQNYGELKGLQDDTQQALSDMAITGNYEKFFTLIEKLLQNLSNRDYIRFDEKHVKMVFLAYLINANIFLVQSEREVAGGGYVDIELFIRPNNPFTHHQFAIELKYLKKEQEALLAETMQEAKEQILNYYRNDTLLQSKKMLNLLAVVTVKDKVFVEKLTTS